MASPNNLFQNIPECYDRRSTKGNYHLLAGLAAGLSNAETDLTEFKNEITVVNAAEDFLNRAGETLGVPRIPNMSDGQYAILIRTMVPIPRGTINAIKQVFEAATGLTGVTVEDRLINGAIPYYEVWIYVTVDSYGYGAFVEPDAVVRANTSAPWPPDSSCVFGTVHDAVNAYGGEYNDHWWSDVDYWTRSIVDSVKIAGTIIVYKTAP